jgi:hypothetical protein
LSRQAAAYWIPAFAGDDDVVGVGIQHDRSTGTVYILTPVGYFTARRFSSNSFQDVWLAIDAAIRAWRFLRETMLRDIT